MRRYPVQRATHRLSTKTKALLVGKFEGIETTVTENLSLHGARVITSRTWQPGQTVLFALPGFKFTSAARVAYCEPLRDGQFGTGLEFQGTSEDLEVSSLAASLAHAT